MAPGVRRGKADTAGEEVGGVRHGFGGAQCDTGSRNRAATQAMFRRVLGTVHPASHVAISGRVD
jgi:hypothetical protein